MTALQELFNMLSNLNFYFVSLCMLLAAFSSCGLKVGEKTKDDSTVEIASVACLDKSMDSLKKIFKAEARDAEIAPALSCLSTTIQTFATKIKGANKEHFTTEELVYFLNKNIITQGTKIPDSLANEIMKIKVSILGGNDRILTKAELNQLRAIIEQMTPDAVKLNKHMPIIVEKWNYDHLTKAAKEKRFNEAHVALTVFTDKLFSYFSKSNTEYDINFGIDLIKEFLVYNDSTAEHIADIETYRRIAVAVKKNLIGDNTAIIKNTDWPAVSKALSSTLFLIQRSAYFMKVDAPDYEFSTYNKVSRYGLMAQDIAADVYEVLHMQGDRIVSHEQIAETFNVVFETFDMNVKITTAMMKDITLLKNAIINVNDMNNVNAWNKHDFLLLKDKLNVLLLEAGMVLSTIDQMDQNPSWKTDYAVFNQMETEFNQSVVHAIQIFEGRYDLQYIKALLVSLKEAELIKTDDFLKDYDKYYNVIVSAKKLITSVGGTSLKANDIKNLLSLAGRGYFHALEYKNYIKPVEFKNEQFAALILSILPKAKSTLNEALKYNLNGFFSTEDFLETYSFACTDLELKAIMTHQSLEVMLKAMWSHLLIDPDHRISGQILPGLNSEALNNLYVYVKLLFDGNNIGAQILKKNANPSQVQIISAIQNQMLTTNDPYELQILKEMNAAFSGPVPLTAQKGYLKILDANSDVYNYADVQMSNIVRVAARLITLSYATSLDNVKKMDSLDSQLTLDELRFGFDQLKSVLYEKDIVNPETIDFIGKRFQDANLFVSRANGDDFASFLEIHDIAIHLMTGSARAKDMRDNIYNYCLTPAALPLNRKTEIYDLCLLDTYYKFNEGLEFIPPFTAQKALLGEAKHKEYSYNLLLAAGHVTSDKQIVLLDDADNFPHIVQYIEMMYAKFDADRNGELVKDEALQAFPTFKHLIKKVVTSMDGGSKIKEEQYPGVFIYFLKYGRGPKTVIEKLQFMSFIGNENKWVVNATRFDIGIVFQFIAISSEPATPPSPPVTP
jgi:hypothetical protein